MDYLPEICEQYRRDYPELNEVYDELAAKLHEVGPLDQPACRLVKLSAAIGGQSPGGVRSHTRNALDEGLSAAEIEQAILLTLTIVGFPATIASLKWAREVFQARQQA